MVYNLFTEGFKMGTWDSGLKHMYAIDNLKKEINEIEYLLSNLIMNDDVYSNTMSHKETGVVYDLTVLTNKVNRLKDKMDEHIQDN